MLVEELCKDVKIPINVFLSHRRGKEFDKKRSIIYKTLLLLGISSVKIGKLCNRNHTSILYSIKKTKEKEVIYLLEKYKDYENGYMSYLTIQDKWIIEKMIKYNIDENIIYEIMSHKNKIKIKKTIDNIKKQDKLSLLKIKKTYSYLYGKFIYEKEKTTET